MTLYVPSYLQAGTYSASLDRQLLDELVSVPGVIGTADLAVSQRGAGANMTVDVAAGRCIVQGTSAAGQGKYGCWSDGTFNIANGSPVGFGGFTAPGTPGQSQNWLVHAKVRDNAVDAGGNNDWILTAVAGTAAATGTQTDPALPASALALARVVIANGQGTITNANITDLRVRVAAGSTPVTRVYRTAGWTTANTEYVYAYDTILIDNMPGTYNTVSGVFTCPWTGKYRVTAQLGFNSTAANQYQLISLYKNAAEIAAGSLAPSTATSQWVLARLTDVASCVATDTISVKHVASTNGLTGAPGLHTCYAIYEYLGL